MLSDFDTKKYIAEITRTKVDIIIYFDSLLYGNSTEEWDYICLICNV